MYRNRKFNSSKINLVISFIFHSALITAIFFLAAREGYLGKSLKKLTVALVAKEKKPEPPKEKTAEPKTVAPKAAEAAKPAAAPEARVQQAAAPPPSEVPAAAAPATVNESDVFFTDGAKEVATASDAKAAYKGMIERALHSRWNRPEDMADDNYVAEVELSVDPTGHLDGYQWLKGSGNVRWDNSVKAALASVKSISHAPPKGFPAKFLVRFDVESERTEGITTLSQK